MDSTATKDSVMEGQPQIGLTRVWRERGERKGEEEL